MVFNHKLIILSILYLIVSSSSFPLQSYPRSIVALYKNKLEKKKPNITSDISYDYTSARVPSYFSQSNQGSWRDVKGRRSNPFLKTGIKRGLDIGIQVKYRSTPKYSDSLEKLEDVLAKALESRVEALNTSACPSCEEEEIPGVPPRRIVKPAFPCDEWESKFRICLLERNIGDTVTFYLSTGHQNGEHKPKVTWRKEFHIQGSSTRREFIIDNENSPENIIIGRKGYELRISPITEVDLGFNMFSATLQDSSSPHGKVFFMIRIVPIDLGFVYVGETIELSLRSYVSLPAESLSFRWFMEKDGEHGTLPSNMRMSVSGSSIKISELRQDQEGVLVCTVYTNLDFLATKKRFLMKDLVKNNDVLKSAPDHNLHFEEDPNRGKRDPKKLIRTKREVDMDDVVEKALMQSTTTERKFTPEHEITTHSSIDYDPGKDIGSEELRIKPSESFSDSYDERENRFQESNHRVSGNREPQSLKQDYSSLDNSPAEIVESQENLMPLDDSELQNGNEGIPPEQQSSVISHSETDKTESERKLHKPNHRQSKFGGNIPNGKSRQGGDFANDEIIDSQYPSSQKKIIDKNEEFLGKSAQNKKNRYSTNSDESEIILNIDKMPGPRRVSAEEKIAKLISSCYSDFECSGSAICVRNNLKYPGFCKCLPGFYGVGIFCREDIWISKSNFELDELHNSEDFSYSSSALSEQNM